MHLCLYVCTSVCMYVCTCLCVYACIYVYVYISFMFICMYYVCICMYISLYVCVYKCIYVCMYVYIHSQCHIMNTDRQLQFVHCISTLLAPTNSPFYNLCTLSICSSDMFRLCSDLHGPYTKISLKCATINSLHQTYIIVTSMDGDNAKICRSW